MILSAIACIDEQNAIGFNNKLLFKNKEDIDVFKQHTIGKIVLMGKNTYESIGKPLKKRINVVLSSDQNYNPHPNVIVRNSIDEVLSEFRNEKELVCIGGSVLYKQMIPLSHYLYITKVHHKFSKVDAFFPRIDENEWKEVYFREGKSGLVPFSFHTYRRSN